MKPGKEIAGFDVEAQESLLDNPAEDQVVSDVETTSDSSARKTLMRLILLLRSTELFKLGANYVSDVTSSSSASPTMTSNEILATQGPGIPSAFEISADPPHDNTPIADSESDDYEHSNDLQRRKNIVEIVKSKNLEELRSFGGVEGVAKALNTDLDKGISSPQKTRNYKPSQLSQFLRIILSSFLGACNTYTIFLLFFAASLLLGFGIKEEGLHMGWFNGGVLLATVFIIVIATTIRKCWEEWSHKNLENYWHSEGRNLQVRVVRGGVSLSVSEVDLEVGDIAVLQKGDQVPGDGLFVTGQTLELDDGLTIQSTTIDENNPFLFYGSRVINGNARMLVTSTSTSTVWGEMMSTANEASLENECKFECYLQKLNICVQIVGLLIFILIIIVLFLRYKAGELDEERRSKPEPKGEPTPAGTIINAIKGIITGSKGTARVLTTLLSVSLLGIMEGIPFSISIAAIVWSSRTLAHKACERNSFSCIKMACLTTICSDKFGGMTENEKEIDKFCVGEEFVSDSSVVASHVLEGLCDGIGTQCLLPLNDQESRLQPLISWTEEKLGLRREVLIEKCKLIRHSGHNPLQEPCRVLMEKNGNVIYLHCKGPAHDILSICSHHYDINGRILEIDEGKRSKLDRTIRHMLAGEEVEVEVVAYACKHVEDFEEASLKSNELILLAMISMRDTKIEDTKRAVLSLKLSGIRTILTSVDDIAVLETIGQKCGLLTDPSDDLIVNGEEFRACSHEERLEKVERIRILGNCLPSDKILLIKCLKEKGVVAVIAQRTVDAPALKQADIGIAYGTWSSIVAKECCDVTIWYGNCFSFLVNFVENGRCFQENIRKFIQLQLIFTISSLLINFVAVVFWGDAPITAAQLFWLSLVVGLVGGLALLTGPPTATLTAPHPSPSAKLITRGMRRNIGIQVSYQSIMFLTLQHKGEVLLGITSADGVKSIIYIGFFLCQMFNMFIARELERKNFFSGLFGKMDRGFWVAFVLFIICLVIFVLAEELIGSSPGLSLKLWGACIVMGLGSWLLDWAGKIASNFF